MDEVIEVINDYIDTSNEIRRAKYVDVASDLRIIIEQNSDSTTSTDAQTTTSAEAATTIVATESIPDEIAVPALESRHDIVVQYLRHLDRTGLDRETLALVDDLSEQVDALHASNEVMLGVNGGTSRFPWWTILVLVAILGAGWIVVWRRRWVSIDVEACTSCGDCSRDCPDFFVTDATGVAHVTTDDASTNDRRPDHRIRLPKNPTDRKRVLDTAKRCEPEAIRVTVRRRPNDPRID